MQESAHNAVPAWHHSSSAESGDHAHAASLDAVTPRPAHIAAANDDYFSVHRHQQQSQSQRSSPSASQQQPYQLQQDPSPSKNSLKPLSLALHKHAPHFPMRSQSSQALLGVTQAFPHPPLLARRQASAASSQHSGFPVSASQPSLQSLQHVPYSSGSSQYHHHHPLYASASDKYSLAKMSLAMDKMEGRSTEVKAGEVGTTVGAVGFGGGDEWQTICVRVLPLFNGETAKGYVEELNDLVTLHARRILDRSPNRALVYLTQHFKELADMGMLTLADKLEHAAGYALLAHLNELWVLFWGAIRPYLLAVFLPYATDRALCAAASKIGQSQQKPPIDVERLLCRSFRDQVIVPLADRLAPMLVREAFETGTASRRSSAAFNDASRTSSGLSLKNRLNESTRTVKRDSSPANIQKPSHDERNVGRALRMQMMSILAMLRTNDYGQERTDILAAALRGFGSTRLEEVDQMNWDHKRGSASTQRGPGPVQSDGGGSGQRQRQRSHWSWTPGGSDEEEEEEDSEDESWMHRSASRQASFTSTTASSVKTSDMDSVDEDGW